MNTSKKIIHLLFEILFAVLIMVGSYMTFCKGENLNEVLALNSSNNKNLEFKEIIPLQLSNIYPITNEDALNTYQKSSYQIINNNNSKVKYRLIYRIYNSDIKVEWFNYYLKINNNETISNLGNLGPKNSNDYVDLIIKEGIIDSNTTIDFNYLIWLDYNVGNEAQNKSFNAKIVLETY